MELWAESVSRAEVLAGRVRASDLRALCGRDARAAGPGAWRDLVGCEAPGHADRRRGEGRGHPEDGGCRKDRFEVGEGSLGDRRVRKEMALLPRWPALITHDAVLHPIRPLSLGVSPVL